MTKRKPAGKLVRLTKPERATLRQTLRQYADAIYGTLDDSENKLFERLQHKLRG